MIDVGIIGSGRSANAHSSAIQSLNLFRLAGFYDPTSQGQAEKLSQIFSSSAFYNLDDFFNRVDAVIVTSPNHTHYSYCLSALETGIHVLCEKPMALTVEEAEEMLDAARCKQVTAKISFNYRYLPVVQELLKLKKMNYLGALKRICCTYKRDTAFRRKQFTWRDSDITLQTSGALGDLGIHLLDLLYFLTQQTIISESANVKCETLIPIKEDQKVMVDDYSRVDARLQNGTSLQLLVSKATLPEEGLGFSLEVIGNQREFFYHSNNGHFYYIGQGRQREQVLLEIERNLPDPAPEIYGWADSFRNQLIDWHRCIQEDKCFHLASFEDGLRAQEILCNLLSRAV